MTNGSLYTGYTHNLHKRIELHMSGKGAKFTRAFKPVKIKIAWRIYESKGLTLKIEHFIKTLTRQQKKSLIISPASLTSLFKKQYSITIKKVAISKRQLEKINSLIF